MRTVKDARLETRAARGRLAVGPRPHWKTLTPVLHLGYRRKVVGQAGMWLARHYRGAERYQVMLLGIADDVGEGEGVLSFAMAAKLAHSVRWGETKRRRTKTGLTVEDAVADYIEWLKVNRATARDAKWSSDALILPHLGKALVAGLTSEMINEWLEAMVAQGARLRGGHQRPRPQSREERRARQATANRVLTVLKAALNKAFRSGLVDDDTAWRRVRPFSRTHRARPGFLSTAECRRLINAADAASGFRDLVVAALQTGARYGELGALLVADFAHGKVHVRQSKSGQSRWITLTTEGVKFFERLTLGRNGSEPLLIRNGGDTWRKGAQQRYMLEACDRAQIVPAVSFHALRHSYTSLCVQSNMNLQVLARNLGHSSTRMTELHYSHLRQSHIDEEIRTGAPKFGIVSSDNVRTLR